VADTPASRVFNACPLCGCALKEIDLTWLPEARFIKRGNSAVLLSRNQARFFNVVWRARQRGAGATREMIMDALYFDDPNGGSASPNIVSVMASAIRRKLVAVKLGINSSAGPQAVYFLNDLP
jgi:hypothetical protein